MVMRLMRLHQRGVRTDIETVAQIVAYFRANEISKARHVQAVKTVQHILGAVL